MKIDAALFDVDGTLLKYSTIDSFPEELPKEIDNMRSQGVAFSLSSGRDRPFLNRLRENMIGRDFKEGEGLIFEACYLQMAGQGETYNLGGLTGEQLNSIKEYVSGRPEWLEEMVFPYCKDAIGLVDFVTKRFVDDEGTDQELLERRYQVIKPAIEAEFPFVRVNKTADAIDVEGKHGSKAKAVRKYSEVTGIPLSNIAYFGDSSNDFPAFEVIGPAGGVVVYVGDDPSRAEKVRLYENGIVSESKGPDGTLQTLKELFRS